MKPTKDVNPKLRQRVPYAFRGPLMETIELDPCSEGSTEIEQYVAALVPPKVVAWCVVVLIVVIVVTQIWKLS